MTADVKKRFNGTFTEILRLSAAVAAVLITLYIYNRTSADTIVNELHSIDNRLAVIEANRFTSQDGLDVWLAISQIRERVAAMPSEVPPAWFLQRVDRIEDQLESLEQKVDAIGAAPDRRRVVT